MTIYRISLPSGQFTHVIGRRAACDAAMQICGERLPLMDLEREYSVRVVKLSRSRTPQEFGLLGDK